MVPDTSYYDALGVGPNASAVDIRRQYKKLALRLHPDKLGRETDEFRLVARANSVLSNPTKRMQYDLYGPSLKPSAGDEMGDGIASIVPVFGGFACGAVPATIAASGSVHPILGVLLVLAAFFVARRVCAASDVADKSDLAARSFAAAVALAAGPRALQVAFAAWS